MDGGQNLPVRVGSADWDEDFPVRAAMILIVSYVENKILIGKLGKEIHINRIEREAGVIIKVWGRIRDREKLVDIKGKQANVESAVEMIRNIMK